MNPESATQPQQPVSPQSAVSQPVENSSKKPVVVILIIILLLGIGAFYYFMVRQENNLSNIKPLSQTPKPIVTVSPTPTPTLVNLDSSDTQLDKDIQSINNKANNLATDVNNVNAGLNDTPLDNGL